MPTVVLKIEVAEGKVADLCDGLVETLYALAEGGIILDENDDGWRYEKEDGSLWWGEG